MLSDVDYKYIYDRVPRLCVSAAVVCSEGVALIKRNIPPHLGKWHLPGGRIQKGETVLQAIRRVARRELGLELPQEHQLLGFMEEISGRYENVDIHNLDLVLKFDVVAQNFSPKAGEGECQWFKQAPVVELQHPIAIRFLLSRGLLRA